MRPDPRTPACARENAWYASHENNAKSPSSPWVYPPQLQQRTLSPIRHSSPGLVTGSDFNITWCTSVKIAVVAPIPSASVIKAVAVNPGAFRSCRSASRKSVSIRPLLYKVWTQLRQLGYHHSFVLLCPMLQIDATDRSITWYEKHFPNQVTKA